MFKLIPALLALVVSVAAAAADTTQPMSQEDRDKAIGALGWQGAGKYPLPASHSALDVPDGYQVLVGEDSRKLVTLTGNPRSDEVEAVVLNMQSYDLVYFLSFAEGYVSLDDWSDVDATAMLSDITANTKAANEERRAQGVAALSVVGWLQQPTLERTTNTVYWAIEVEDGKEHYANSVALKLSRDGYEKLVWVTPKTSFVAAGGDLAKMMAAHGFDEGHRYADHTGDDKVAAYGIAGLVAAVAGAKALKIVAAGGLLLLLKKFGVIIVAAVGGLIYKLKRGSRKTAS